MCGFLASVPFLLYRHPPSPTADEQKPPQGGEKDPFVPASCLPLAKGRAGWLAWACCAILASDEPSAAVVLANGDGGLSGKSLRVKVTAGVAGFCVGKTKCFVKEPRAVQVNTHAPTRTRLIVILRVHQRIIAPGVGLWRTRRSLAAMFPRASHQSSS